LRFEALSIVEDASLISKSKRIKSLVQTLKWTGVDDLQLFDTLHGELQRYIEKAAALSRVPSSRMAEHLSWLAQGLAISGRDKYVESIDELANMRLTSKVRRHATNSLKVLPQFQQWNPDINKDLAGVPLVDLMRFRTINMLNSSYPELPRVGAKLVTKLYLDDIKILGLVEARLLELHVNVGTDAERAER
jgi:hypothetical protein